MHTDSDDKLIRECQRGDRKAFESLVRRYERPVFNTAYRMLGNSDEAVDVSQTAFLKAFENLGKYDPSYKFFSWIYRITLNEAIDQINRKKRERPLVDDQRIDGHLPQDDVFAGEMAHRIQAILMDLTEEHRAVIVLRYFSESSYQEISEILRLPEKTVKSRLFSARRRMKSMLTAQGIFSP